MLVNPSINSGLTLKVEWVNPVQRNAIMTGKQAPVAWLEKYGYVMRALRRLIPERA